MGMTSQARIEDPTKARTPRALADAYVNELAELNPLLSTALGVRPYEDRRAWVRRTPPCTTPRMAGTHG